MTIPLTIARVPMSNALVWYRNAWRLIQAQPLILILSVAWAFLSWMMITSFPFIGAIAGSFLIPFLAFGLANICQKIRINQTISPIQVFSAAFGPMRTRLFSLGAYYAAAVLGCILLTKFIDGGHFMQIALGLDAPVSSDPIALAQEFSKSPNDFFKNHPTILATVAFLSGMLAIISVFVFAPMFVGWQNANASQAVGLSLISIVRNILSIGLAIILTVATLFGFLILATIATDLFPFAMFFISMFLVLFNITFLSAMAYTTYYGIMSVSLKNSVKASIGDILDLDENKNDSSNPT